MQIDHFGSLEALQIRDVPDTALPEDAVRVEIEAAGVNPSDVGVALGRFPSATLPRVFGRDFAGRIVDGKKDHACRVLSLDACCLRFIPSVTVGECKTCYWAPCCGLPRPDFHR